MNLCIILFAVITIATSSVKGSCPSEEKLHTCQDKDNNIICVCPDFKGRHSISCTCYVEYLDCLDALRKGQTKSDVYVLKPNNLEPFTAYCDMDTDGGGWTVFQRRMDGSVDFYLGWTNYIEGFGNISGEYWLGLSRIYRLANGSVSTQLRVDMKDKNGSSAYASYSTFYIGGSTTKYTLHVSGYNGTAGGDSLAYSNGRKFSTKDNDNDVSGRNCAATYGAWWNLNCHYANLNGRYGDDRNHYGINWYAWKGHYYSLPFAEMKIRRV